MLFDISTGKPYTIPAWAREKMKASFPDFYEGKSVRIKCIEERKRKRLLVKSGDSEGDSPRVKMEAPTGNSRKAKGWITDPETGDVVHIQYSSAQPRVLQNGVLKFSYPNNMVVVSDGMHISPRSEDLLFYVHFLCPHIKDNSCEDKSMTPFYTYDRPDVDAKQKISAARSKASLEKLIYFDVDYSVIKKTLDAVGIKSNDSEEQDRVMLLDKLVKGTETFKDNVMSTLNSLSAKAEKGMSDEVVSDIISELLEKGLIKYEVGNWYERDGRGDGTKFKAKPFFEGKDTDDSRFDLYKHLETNRVLFDRLKNLK